MKAVVLISTSFLLKEQINKKIVALAGTIIVTVFSCNSSSDFVYFTGLTAAVASMLCALSPLPAVVDAVRSKSTEMLPFPIICSSVFVSSLWLLYGYLVGDPFVQVIATTVSRFNTKCFSI